MKKYKVVYAAKYICEVEVEEGQTLSDAFGDIEIPEGFANHSVYKDDSFKVIKYKEIKD